MSVSPLPSSLNLWTSAATLSPPLVRPRLTSLCLLASDAAAVTSASFLGVFLWQLANPSVSLANYFNLVGSIAAFLAVYAALGLYSPAGLSPVQELKASLQGTAIVALAHATGAFLSKEIATYSRGAFLCSAALIAFLVPAARALLRTSLARKRWWGVPVAILGAGESAARLLRTLHSSPELGFKPVACFDDDPARSGFCSGVPVLGPLSEARRIAPQHNIRHAIVAMPGITGPRMLAILEQHCSAFPRVTVLSDLLGVASLWVTPREIGNVLGLELRQNLLIPLNRTVKRALDVTLTLLLTPAAIPLILLSAIWIRLRSPGPVLYRQPRQGHLAAIIQMPKIRTMLPNADALLEHHLAQSPGARGEWQRFFKLHDDPRVIPGIGHFLRRTSLDELPQLWSVLTGEMSLVGPRPFPQYHLDRFHPDFRALRAKVRPGLTGLWQVSARSDGDLAVQQQLDTYYIRNWSPWLDLHILARTVAVVLSGKGAR